MREIRPSGSMRGGDCVPSTLQQYGYILLNKIFVGCQGSRIPANGTFHSHL